MAEKIANQHSMELGQFVSDTIVQIIDGVSSAMAASSAISPTAKVNPYRSDAVHSDPVSVEFDVAVTATDKSIAEGGGGMKIAVLSLNAGGSKSAEMQSVSRIRFAVPVALPSTLIEQYR